MNNYVRKYKGQTIYRCKVNGCVHPNAICGSISCATDQCKANGNFKCIHKVKIDD